MALKFEIYLQTSQATLTVRTRTTIQDLSSVLKQAYDTIIQYLQEKGEQPAGPPFAAFYHMNETDLDITAGFPVFPALPGRDPIEAGQLPAGKVASCLFTGPYDAMETAYDELKRWIRHKGFEPTGIRYEIYMNDPAYTPPMALKTQIIIPLEGKDGLILE